MTEPFQNLPIELGAYYRVPLMPEIRYAYTVAEFPGHIWQVVIVWKDCKRQPIVFHLTPFDLGECLATN